MRAGKSLSFACDSKSIITKWYAKLYASAPLDVQLRMRLNTSVTEIDIEEDWTDLIIFFHPRSLLELILPALKAQSSSFISLARAFQVLTYYKWSQEPGT